MNKIMKIAVRLLAEYTALRLNVALFGGVVIVVPGVAPQRGCKRCQSLDCHSTSVCLDCCQVYIEERYLNLPLKERYSFLRMVLAHEIGHLAQDAEEHRNAVKENKLYNPEPIIRLEEDAWNRARKAFGKSWWWDKELEKKALNSYYAWRRQSK